MENNPKIISKEKPTAPVMTDEVKEYFKALRAIKTPARIAASKNNGKKGGRPKKKR